MTDIQQVRAITNPQRAYQWEVTINGLSTGNNADLVFHAKTVAIPNSQVDTFAINYKAAHVYFAGRDSSSHTVTITFWDDESQKVREYFQNWFDTLMFNPLTGGQTPKNLYTADINLRLMDSSGDVSTAKIVLTDAFPSEIGDISLSYETSDALELSVTFMYDVKSIVNTAL